MTRVTVTGFTAARMLEIEQTTVTSGRIIGDNLVLVTRGGQEITAGNVRGEKGLKGDAGGVWDATSSLIGGIKIAGNIGGTAAIPKVTGALDATVDSGLTKVTESVPNAAGGTTSTTKSLKELMVLIYTNTYNTIARSGKAKTLWVGNITEYNALSTAIKTDAGFVGVITT